MKKHVRKGQQGLRPWAFVWALFCSTTGAMADPTVLRTIVNHMGSDTVVTDAQYSKYFREGIADRGVAAVVSAGQFFINGFAIPGTESEFKAKFSQGYQVNKTPWLFQEAGAWRGGIKGERAFSTYADAALATAVAIPAGLEVQLLDTNYDGFADRIETRYLEALIVGSLSRDGSGWVKVDRGQLDPLLTPSTRDGRPFDGSHFTADSGDLIRQDLFDSGIHQGDVGLVWFAPEGWRIERAKEIHGTFAGGADHQFYQIDQVKFQDAMRFSRDNLIISNRPGEFSNAQQYFGLTKGFRDWSVSLWIVPTSGYPATTGAPIGFTTGRQAPDFLGRAIELAQKKLAAVTVSADGRGLAAGTLWTTQVAHDELSDAIDRAKVALSRGGASNLLDYQVYLLFLTLHGATDDIGARFAGYQAQGFDPQVRTAGL